MSSRTPQSPPDPGTLPRPLTFFLDADERRDVLRALKSHHADRARALLLSLGLPVSSDAKGAARDGE